MFEWDVLPLNCELHKNVIFIFCSFAGGMHWQSSSGVETCGLLHAIHTLPWTLCAVLWVKKRLPTECLADVKYFAMAVMCCCMGRAEVMDRMVGRCETLCDGRHALYGQRRGYRQNACQM